MKKIAVTSDSTCALSLDKAKEIGLKILPLNVIVDGVEYHDGIDIDNDKLADMMKRNCSIKTSTPTPYEIETFFNEIFKEGYDEIIHFTISSKLSSMFDLFTNTCKEKYGDKVKVIDSKSICVYMLNHVLTAFELAKQGMDADTIVKEIEKRISTENVYFIPESLTYLKRGGRISPAVALIGNLIGMKPILRFVNGGIEKDSTTRNVKKSIDDYVSKVKSLNLDPNIYEIGIVLFDTKENIVSFAQETIKRELPEFNVTTSPLSINVCAHTGPGTIGIGTHHRILK